MGGNRIHPTAIIADTVTLGEGNTIGPYAIIAGTVRMGNGNWVGPHASIGTPAQMRGGPHPAWDETDEHGIDIGSGNVIREAATIHSGSERTTFVGDNCYLMTGSHVPHDAIISDGVTLANNVHLGGHTWIGEQANLGLGVQVHQRSTIGGGAMIGMNATVTRPIPPFSLAVGTPARVRGANVRGLERLGLDPLTVEALDGHYRDPGSGMPDLHNNALSAVFDVYIHRITLAAEAAKAS